MSGPYGSCAWARAAWITVANTSVAARRRAALDGIFSFRSALDRHQPRATEPLMLGASGQVKRETGHEAKAPHTASTPEPAIGSRNLILRSRVCVQRV